MKAPLETAGPFSLGIKMQISAAQTNSIQSFRHEMRGAGCWGACYEAACFIEHQFGWRRVDGVYALPDGRPIFYHSWNMLDDGVILDGTADQFGEGRDVAVCSTGDDVSLRYRQKFTAAHNPLITPWLAGVSYTGVPDQVFWHRAEASRQLKPGWWLADPEPYLSWFRSGALLYPMFAKMRDRYRERGYEVSRLV